MLRRGNPYIQHGCAMGLYVLCMQVRRGTPHIQSYSLPSSLTTSINLVEELRVDKDQGQQEHGNSRVRRGVRTGSLTCKVIRTALVTAQTTD
jgi:hypothetical protein